MKETQLVCCVRPYLPQDRRIELGAIRDHLCRVNAHRAPMRQEALDIPGVNVTVHQLVTDQPVALWRPQIYGQQQGQLVLIHFVNAKDARELSDHPLLIVHLEIERCPIGATPGADPVLTGQHPEIPRQARRRTPYRHPIREDGLNGFAHHLIRIDASHFRGVCPRKRCPCRGS